MSERDDNNELIRKIAETLRNHVEPYREGAWEGFSAKVTTPKRRMSGWPYWSAAAAAILITVGALQLNRDHGQQPAAPQVVENPSAMPLGSAPAQEEPLVVPELPAQVEQSAVAEQRPRLAYVPPVDEDATKEPTTPAADELIPTTDEQVLLAQSTVDAAPASQQQAVAAAEVIEKPEKFQDGQAPLVVTPIGEPTEVYAAADRVEKSIQKWDLGLAVLPSMTSEELGVGGGIAIAYRLSDRLSIGSGLSIARFGLGENPNYQPSGGFDRMDSPVEGYANSFVTDRQGYKRDISLTSRVVALDIPLDFRYAVAKGFYAAVGVSYVAVLNEQRTEHFVDRINQPTFEQSNSAHKDLASSVQAVYSAERSANEPLQGRGYTGFMNFSVGRKVPLAGKISVSLEPYFKLPIGRLSREEMDFTNGGIRIVTGF